MTPIKLTSCLLACISLGWLPACGNLGDVASPAENVGYLPDGTAVVYTAAGLKLYDTDLKREKKSIQLSPAAGTVDQPFTFDLSRDGTTAVVSYSNTATTDLVFFQLPGGQRLQTIDVDMPPLSQRGSGAIPVQQITLSPAGDLIYVRAEAAGVYDSTTGARLWGLDGLENAMDPVVFSADGTTVFGIRETSVPTPGAMLVAASARTGETLFSVEAGARVTALELSADGTTVLGLRQAAATSPESYAFWSVGDGSLVKELPQFPGFAGQGRFPSGVALTCAAVDDLCATGVNDGDQILALVWRTDGTLLHRLKTVGLDGKPYGVNDLAFSPDATRLAIAGGDAKVFRLSDEVIVSDRTYTYDLF